MLIYTPLFLLSIFHIAAALRNISLDDPDPAIDYHGNWLHTPYDPTNKGGHHRVTADNNAYATLAFSGVALYFYSPLWPFRVTTALSLDGDQPDLLDLRDYSVPFLQDGSETANSSIVWYTDGLENTSHLLNVSVGVGEDLAILDYLVYTVLDPGDSPITPTSVSDIHTRSIPVSSSSSSSPSPQPTFTSSSSTKVGLSITLAVVCVIFTAIVLWAFFWWWKRRHTRRLDELSITSSHGSMSEATTRRPSYPRTTGIPYPSRVKNFPLAIRRIPSRRSSSRRSTGPSSRSAFGSRGAKKTLTLTPIPESSGDHLHEEVEDSASQGSSTTATIATAATSPESSVKNDRAVDGLDDSPPPPQHDSPTVRLVTDS